MSADVQGHPALQTTKTRWWSGKAVQIVSLQSWSGTGRGVGPRHIVTCEHE